MADSEVWLGTGDGVSEGEEMAVAGEVEDERREMCKDADDLG